MPDIARSARDMIAGMTPEARPGTFVFVTAPDPVGAAACTPHAIATFRESEGLSMILPVDVAGEHGFDLSAPMRCITLAVYSALDGVGLTSAVATALAGADIPCNMVAAFHHDHVFVPAARAGEALDVLRQLQDAARAGA